VGLGDEVKSGDRLLTVLWLFSAERPVLEVEDMARRLQISLSTAYRYVGQLCDAGFLAPMGSLGYGLGPAIIELDRQIRLADPLVRAAGPVLRRLLADLEPTMTILLCRLYRDQVMCVAQRQGREAMTHLSYERGRPMPMLRGAPSKAILAYLPGRAADRLCAAQAVEPGKPRVDYVAFKAELARIRKAGIVVSHSEIDPNVIGVAACVFDPDGRPIGSVCTVLPEEGAPAPAIARVSTLTRASADEITAILFEQDAALQPAAPSPTRRGRDVARRLDDESASMAGPRRRIH